MAWHKLHHEELTFAMREVIHHSWQCRMSQVRQQLSFTTERATLFVGSSESLFDSDNTTQILVHRLIDCAHPAVAELMNDAIALAKNCIGGKHCVRPCQKPARQQGLLWRAGPP